MAPIEFLRDSYNRQPDGQMNIPVCESKPIWLVVWKIFFMTFQYFPYIGNVIIPTDFHVFQRGGEKPPTSYNYQVRVYFGV
jgi:hypothetical protein